MNKPARIGLTGGIGSGKTTVARIFEKLGVPVFYSDEYGKKAYADPEVQKAVRELLGPAAYGTDGNIDREYLRAQLFRDKELLSRLETIIHPWVRRQFVLFCEAHAEQVYVINEAAILFEKGQHKAMDHVLLVTADREERIRRVMNRDGISRGDVEKRMALQESEESKILRAGTVIVNDEEATLDEKVFNIHKIFMTKNWGI